MTDGCWFLSELLSIGQISQCELQYSIKLTSSHRMKDALADLLKEYDEIESEIQFLAARRGWELLDCQPVLFLQSKLCFRIKIGRKRTDSHIAKTIVRQSIDHLISLQHYANHMDLHDRSCLILLQKIQDCIMTIPRRMQIYL